MGDMPKTIWATMDEASNGYRLTAKTYPVSQEIEPNTEYTRADSIANHPDVARLIEAAQLHAISQSVLETCDDVDILQTKTSVDAFKRLNEALQQLTGVSTTRGED